MFMCVACHAKEGREDYVDEVFRVDGQYVLVGSIPALVCAGAVSSPSAVKLRRRSA